LDPLFFWSAILSSYLKGQAPAQHPLARPSVPIVEAQDKCRWSESRRSQQEPAKSI
jgi:hypothetical protein